MSGDLLQANNIAAELSPSQTTVALNMPFGTGSSTLHRACEQDDVELAEFLLSRGATVHVHPVTGFSPLHSACASGATRCAHIMLQVWEEGVELEKVNLPESESTCVHLHLHLKMA